MRRLAAFALLFALAACESGSAAEKPVETPSSAPPSVTMFSRFAVPCPTVGDRPGSPIDEPLDTPISLTADCAYGSRTKFPHVNSLSTINKPGNPKGTPDEITVEAFEKLRLKASTNSLEGIFSEERELGDEAFLMVSHADNTTVLVVRKANALVQASATIDAVGDQEKALTQLRALEPQVTAVAQAVLAELR
ncbi:MAG: hypothetical protein ABW022_09550 [Actinoplanes sp.]